MKFSTLSTTAILLTASLSISARPTGRRGGARAGSRGSRAQAVGAAYFMTNEPNGNYIVSSTIGVDGQVKFSGATCAQGRGSHGNDGGVNGPDPLFTQDSIKVGGGNLYTVNAGSNTVVMFSISENDPSKITMVGGPVGSGGEFPVAVAFSEAKNQVCVVNGGAVNGVSCYKPDPELGLVQIPNTVRSLGLNQTTPATGPPGSVSDIVFNADGSKLIVSVKGIPPAQAGFLATWDVAADGSLSTDFTSATPAQGGLVPFSMTLVPGKEAILATDAAVGFSVFDFSAGNNATSTIIPIEGQAATCWSNVSPKTSNFYLTDIGTSTVTEVAVGEDLAGSIVNQYPLAAGSATIDNAIASFGGNDFLYVLSANVTSIDVLSLDAPGRATPMQTLNFADAARRAGVTINANQVQGMAVFVPSA